MPLLGRTYDFTMPQVKINFENYRGDQVTTNELHSTPKNPVVVVRNVHKSFKSGQIKVLEDFSMTVQKGTVYSLLGSSGCGKTTTLSCMVGMQKVNRGDIFVYGQRPCSRGSGVPGKRVGYMPQDTSLYDDFSIAETLYFFGQLGGMDKTRVLERIGFLTKLLHLPNPMQRVGTLSGGQRRRVSFSCALVHEPELLLLDEPTAGVDPLLRESIWNHLLFLSVERGITVILTTHYIDEAKPSHTVGVMRSGQLIAENCPKMLMNIFNTTSLETVVLNLCKQHHASTTPAYVQPAIDYTVDMQHKGGEDFSQRFRNSGQRIKALVGKNLIIMLRNLLLLIFVTLIPAVIIYLTCVAFKDDPKNLGFGIVNMEANMSLCYAQSSTTEGECDIENLSCRFIRELPLNALTMKTYGSIKDATRAVKSAEIWGYMVVPEDYSSNYYERATSGGNVEEETLNKSEIIVQLDQSNTVVYSKIRKSLIDTLEKFSQKVMQDCGYDERQAAFPLQYNKPIFGNDGIGFLNFVAPGLSLGWILFFPILSTSIRYIGEKKGGTMERSLVGGVKLWEIIVAYTITELSVLITQSVLVYMILTLVFGLEAAGSPVAILVLSIMTGFCGMVCGFMMGTLCNEEVSAALLTIAIFFPNSFVSGMMWPKEGMPMILQYTWTYTPSGWVSEAMRSLYARGWEFTHPNVWPGFLSVSIYIVFYILLTFLINKLKSRS